ncbi:membrane protein [Streptomyces fumanus]|uniref:Membrane protein n=2 Tax=Streptomyces fumanus TaxID=67302 RepID=A0A919A8B3_9ACTN|nr:membrane protein [Streptomyces fumanus]
MASGGGADLVAPRSLRAPGIVLGVGIGGFVDGILLHQLLRWHHMLTSTDDDRIGVKYYDPNTVSGLEMNTVWDGVFHAVCWVAVVGGLGLLYSRVTQDRRAVWGSRVLWGWVLVGWGLFNLVEGVLDHHILGIHHVRGGPHQVWWDVAFLVLGLVLVGVGYLVQRGGRVSGRRS